MKTALVSAVFALATGVGVGCAHNDKDTVAPNTYATPAPDSTTTPPAPSMESTKENPNNGPSTMTPRNTSGPLTK